MTKNKYISDISESESSYSSSDEEKVIIKKKITSKKNSEINNGNKKNITKKDLKNLDKQRELFDKIKKLLGVKKNDKIFVFTSFKLNDIRSDLIDNYLPEIKKIFSYKVWKEIEPDNKFCDISLLRKLFKYYEYNIISSYVSNNSEKYKKYTIFKIP